VLEDPGDIEARGQMLLGAAYAGTAIENSMLGAAHSAANPLTAHFGTIHGQAVGLMLPHVVKFNSEDIEAKQAYAELASAAEIAKLRDGLDAAVDSLVDHLEKLLDLTDMPKTISAAGGNGEIIPTLAEEASKQWTANFNPRSVGASDFERLYTAAF